MSFIEKESALSDNDKIIIKVTTFNKCFMINFPFMKLIQKITANHYHINNSATSQFKVKDVYSFTP
ncbi:MAG: hypothetical protein EBY15_11335 [Gammaproteobacteria bacterium]|nr:hypothetical protein [Gammaproteobacteria bacterium]